MGRASRKAQQGSKHHEKSRQTQLTQHFAVKRTERARAGPGPLAQHTVSVADAAWPAGTSHAGPGTAAADAHADEKHGGTRAAAAGAAADQSVHNAAAAFWPYGSFMPHAETVQARSTAKRSHSSAQDPTPPETAAAAAAPLEASRQRSCRQGPVAAAATAPEAPALAATSPAALPWWQHHNADPVVAHIRFVGDTKAMQPVRLSQLQQLGPFELLPNLLPKQLANRLLAALLQVRHLQDICMFNAQGL